MPAVDLNLNMDRPSLIPVFTKNIKPSYGPYIKLIVDIPTDGEESENETTPDLNTN
jgi:hypothetical protein